MRCDEVMSADVQSIRERDTALAAAKLMRHANVGFLPVCDDEGKVVGAITDRDLVVRLGAESGSWHTPMSRLMSKNVVTCRPDDDLTVIEEMMCTYRTSRIVCIDERGRPRGVVSLADVARHETWQNTAHTLREIITREPAHSAVHG